MLHTQSTADRDTRPARVLRIAMVSAFGSRKGGYFSDTLLGL